MHYQAHLSTGKLPAGIATKTIVVRIPVRHLAFGGRVGQWSPLLRDIYHEAKNTPNSRSDAFLFTLALLGVPRRLAAHLGDLMRL